MGGRGSKFGSAASAKTKMDSAAARMEKYAGQAMQGKNFNAEGSKKYYKAQREFNDARTAYNNELNKKIKDKAPAKKKTFVNSYGEATTREITSTSYKNAQKRLNKEIMNRAILRLGLSDYNI